MTYSRKKQNNIEKKTRKVKSKMPLVKRGGVLDIAVASDLIDAQEDYEAITGVSYFLNAQGNLIDFVNRTLFNPNISMVRKEKYLIDAIDTNKNSQNFEKASESLLAQDYITIHKIPLTQSTHREVRETNIPKLINENPGVNILHLAARFCMKKFFKEVLNSNFLGEKPEELKDEMGFRPLHYAAVTNFTKNPNYNTLDFIRLLITHDQRSVEVNAQTNNGETALHFACTDGNLELVKLLVENDADMRIFDKRGKNAFHNASRGTSLSHLEIIKYLDAKYREGNEKKVPVNIKNKESGYTCLHYAASSTNVKMFELLISLGADITNIENDTNDIPLGIDPDLAHNIIDKRGYEIVTEKRSEDELNNDSIGIIQIIIDSGVNINNSNTKGITPLQYLCNEFHSENFDHVKNIIKIDLRELFIDNGAYPYAKNKDQQGIMCYKKGAKNLTNSETDKTLQLQDNTPILDTEATKNMTDYFDKKWGSESLKFMFEKDINGFKSYLNKNQNMSTDVDETKSTLLHNLVFLHRNTKCIDYVKAFLEAYPDVDLEIKNGKGQTVFDIATERKDKVMEDLLSNSKGIKQKRIRKGREKKEREEKDKLTAQKIKETDDKLKQEQSRIQEKENQLKQEQSKIQELQQKLLEKEKLLQKKSKSSKKRSLKKQKKPLYYEEDEDDEDDFIIEEDEEEYKTPKPKKPSKKRNANTTKKLKKKYSRSIVV